MPVNFFEKLKLELRQINQLYSTRSQIDLAANLAPPTDAHRKIEEVVINRIWANKKIWDVLPEGVSVVNFENGIKLRRNSPDDDNTQSASWTLEDVNRFFVRKYPNWPSVEVKKRK